MPNQEILAKKTYVDNNLNTTVKKIDGTVSIIDATVLLGTKTVTDPDTQEESTIESAWLNKNSLLLEDTTENKTLSIYPTTGITFNNNSTINGISDTGASNGYNIAFSALGGYSLTNSITNLQTQMINKQDRMLAGDHIRFTATQQGIEISAEYPPTFSANKNGLVPKPETNLTKFLRGDGTWATVDKGSTIYYGTTAPAADLGLDGDMYIKYSSDTIVAIYCKANDLWKSIEFNTRGSGGSSFRTANATEHTTINNTFEVTYSEVTPV